MKNIPPKIICEIGHNHNGSLIYAKKYVEDLISIKPDAITFQFREPDRYKGANYKLQLNDLFYERSIQKIQENGIDVGIAIADLKKIPFFEELNVKFYKVLSMDIENYALIEKLISTKKIVYVSTGMSNYDQIQKFVDFIGHQKNRFRLIHTQLTYEIKEINLKAINILKDKFGLPVAYGSHSNNKNIIYASTVLEPHAIFFYVKGKRIKKHLDEDHAINLLDCTSLIKNILDINIALGSGEKRKMINRIKENEK